MKNVKNLKLVILGKDYLISTDEDENSIQKAALLVDSLMKEVIQKTSVNDLSKVAVLVALKLANDLNRTQEEVVVWNSQLEKLHNILDNNT